MQNNYTHIIDLAKKVEPPKDGILTRTLFNNEDVKAVIFGFGKGEELSEHTASMPAILHFLEGEATLTLGDDRRFNAEYIDFRIRTHLWCDLKELTTAIRTNI